MYCWEEKEGAYVADDVGYRCFTALLNSSWVPRLFTVFFFLLRSIHSGLLRVVVCTGIGWRTLFFYGESKLRYFFASYESWQNMVCNSKWLCINPNLEMRVMDFLFQLDHHCSKFISSRLISSLELMRWKQMRWDDINNQGNAFTFCLFESISSIFLALSSPVEFHSRPKKPVHFVVSSYFPIAFFLHHNLEIGFFPKSACLSDGILNIQPTDRAADW